MTPPRSNCFSNGHGQILQRSVALDAIEQTIRDGYAFTAIDTGFRIVSAMDTVRPDEPDADQPHQPSPAALAGRRRIGGDRRGCATPRPPDSASSRAPHGKTMATATSAGGPPAPTTSTAPQLVRLQVRFCAGTHGAPNLPFREASLRLPVA